MTYYVVISASVFRKLASDSGLWLSLGGVHSLREAGEERTSNSHLVISDTGALMASYDKTHLFDVEIPGSVSLCESAYVTPGRAVTPPVVTPLGKLGLGICYDLRWLLMFLLTNLLHQCTLSSDSGSSVRVWRGPGQSSSLSPPPSPSRPGWRTGRRSSGEKFLH